MTNQTIIGKIVDVRYVSPDNEYAVADFLSDENENIVITGALSGVDIGDKIKLTGMYVQHKIYGEQFKVSSYIPIKPDDIESIYDFLSSGVINGIGKNYAKKIIDVFGVNTLEIIEKMPEKLLEIEGIGSKKLDKIITSYHEKMNLKNIIINLSKYDLSTSLSIKIYNTYADNAINILNSNPYKLCDDIRGIGFKKADEIAKKMGVALDSCDRKMQAILFILNQSVFEGHTYIQFEKLKKSIKELIDFEDDEELLEILYELYSQRKIILDREKEEINDIKIYLYSYALAETNVAAKLIDLASYEDEKIDYDKLDEIVSERLKYSKIDLSKEQIQSVYMAIKNNILVLTGGPGTGKTTTLSFIIEIFESIGKKVKLCAPTGKASKRMSQATGKDASTIHRLLDMGYNYDLDEAVFAKISRCNNSR